MVLLGTYMLLESSYPQRPNDTAVLMSEVIPLDETSQGFCFRFWYNMFGADVGSLIVYIKYKDMDKQQVWSKVGSSFQAWNQGEANIPTPIDSFVVRVYQTSCYHYY